MRRRLTRRCSRPAAGDAHGLAAQPRAAGLLNGRLVSQMSCQVVRCVIIASALGCAAVACDAGTPADASQPASTSAPPHRFQFRDSSPAVEGWATVVFVDTAVADHAQGAELPVMLGEGVTPVQAEAILNFVATLKPAPLAGPFAPVTSISSRGQDSWVAMTGVGGGQILYINGPLNALSLGVVVGYIQ